MKVLITLLSAATLAISAQATTFSFKPVDSISGDSNHNDLGDLDHTSAYTWGITGLAESALKDELLSGNFKISSAVISISNIYNWDRRDTNNQLFMHLLDNPYAGVKRITDDPTDNGINQGVLSDYFGQLQNGNPLTTNKVNGKYVAYGFKNTTTAQVVATGATNTYITQYHDADGPVTKVNFSFALESNPTLLAVLESYITNGHTGGSSYADFGLGFDPDCHFYNNGVTFTVETSPYSVPDTGATLALLGSCLAGLAAARRKLGKQ